VRRASGRRETTERTDSAAREVSQWYSWLCWVKSECTFSELLPEIQHWKCHQNPFWVEEATQLCFSSERKYVEKYLRKATTMLFLLVEKRH